MKFEIVRSINEEAWRSFVYQHPSGNIFNTPEMFQVFKGSRGYHPQLHAAVDINGDVKALLVPVQITLLNGLLRRVTTRAIAYGSVLCTPDPHGNQALATLLDTYNQSTSRQALFTELRNLSDLSPLQEVLEKSGYAYSEQLNFLIDLSCPPEQVLQNIGTRTRKHIRQGLRKGNVVVEQLSERNQISLWYDLVSKTYQNARVPLADLSLFESAFDVLQPLGMVQFWRARINSAFVAASAELVYKQGIYGWYSGVDRTYAAENPGEMLMWHILEWGAKNGYKTYDFGGAGKPSEEYGVRDFKAKFGGQMVCFGRNMNIHAPKLFRLSELVYRTYRQILRFSNTQNSFTRNQG